CQITGIAAPADRTLDGTSIGAIFSGGTVARAKPLYWQYIFAPSKPQIALRQGPWKILAWLDGPRPKPREITPSQMQLIKSARLAGFELYNLEVDPAEKNDLSATQPAKLAELRTILEKIHADVRAEGPVWPDFEDSGYEQRVIKWPDYVAKPLRRDG
ncbi:MAG: arylsulfatase, partial [Verrucomicrobiota bacterium]